MVSGCEGDSFRRVGGTTATRGTGKVPLEIEDFFTGDVFRLVSVAMVPFFDLYLIAMGFWTELFTEKLRRIDCRIGHGY